MRKYILIILIALTHNCYAQQVKYFDASKYPIDSIKKIIISPDSVWIITVDTIPIIGTNVQAQTKEYPSPFFYDEHHNIFVEIDTVPPIDSSKIYYKKYVLYQALFNQELNRLNRLKKPQLSQRLLDYQDSLIKYKVLLNRLSKK